MKRISHRELEELRNDLNSWVAKQKGDKGFMRGGYSQGVKLAINYFHKTQSFEEAYLYMIKYLDKSKLNNLSRRQEAENELASYCNWNKTDSAIMIERRPNIALKLSNEIILGGQVSRIDMDPENGKCRGILLSNFADNWRHELRMPLIQKAIAVRLQRDETDVMVGVQHVSGTSLQTHFYSSSEIAAAYSEASHLTSKAAELLAS